MTKLFESVDSGSNTNNDDAVPPILQETRKDLATAKAQLQSARVNQQEMKEELDKKETLNRECTKQTSEGTSALAAVSSSADAREGDLRSARQTLSMRQDAVKSAGIALASSQKKKASAHKALESAQAEIAAAEKEYRDLGTQLSAAERQLSDEKKSTQQLEARLDQLRQAKFEMETAMYASASGHEKKADALRNIASAQADIGAAKEKQRDLGPRIQALYLPDGTVAGFNDALLRCLKARVPMDKCREAREINERYHALKRELEEAFDGGISVREIKDPGVTGKGQ